MREIVLDTETTGIGPDHRVIEVGAVELENMLPTGRTFHRYVNPGRKVDPGAFRVHGISDSFLADKPKFLMIAGELLKFIADADLVAHNANFDKEMLDREYERLGVGKIQNTWVDTLPLARKAKPGGKHTLDVLCKHYGIGNTHRKLHGALLDSQLLAEVYLHLRGGRQMGMGLALDEDVAQVAEERPSYPPGTFRRPRLSEEDLARHAAFVATLSNPVWSDYTEPEEEVVESLAA